MTTNRLLSKQPAQTSHTADTILAKLDTDMSDSARKAYLKLLIENPETALLMEIVATMWQKRHLETQIELLKIQEKLRMENIFLDGYHAYPVIDEKNPERSTAVKIPQMKAHIKQDEALLNTMQADYDASTKRADKTLELTGIVLAEIGKELGIKDVSVLKLQ